MNIVRIPRLLRNTAFLISFACSSIMLTACGGGDGKKSSGSSSSSSSSTSSHTFSSTPITNPGSGTWPDVKVSASNTKTLKFEWSAAPDATFYKLFKKVDSTSEFVQVGTDFSETTITDAVSVHLTDWVNSRYKVQACNVIGCTDSSPIVIDNAMLSSITYIKASNAEANDWFGWSVAVSADGNTMAIGAPNEASIAVGINGEPIKNPPAGAVYVFIKVNGLWQEQAYLKASNAEQKNDNPELELPNDRFGYQIALSADGSTLAVSAINEDSWSEGINCDKNDYTYYTSSSTAYHTQSNIGAVYVFKRTGGAWAEEAYIKPYYTVSEGSFGNTLAISGDGTTLAIGHVANPLYVAGILTPNNSSSSSCINFSSSFSFSSNSNNSSSSSSSSKSSSNSSSSSSIPGGPNSGAVYIYKFVDTAWVEKARVKASDAGQEDEFGASIALTADGNLMAVGAVGEDSKDSTAANEPIELDGLTSDGQTTVPKVRAALNPGAVYVFQNLDGAWSQLSKVKPVNSGWNQQFGYSVSLSGDGNTLAVGTPGDWSKAAGVNGSATDYTYEATVSVSNGQYFIFPRAGSSYSTGAVYLFARSGASWLQEAYIKASTSTKANQFGRAVALSQSGNVLAVGTWIDSSRATGINGDQLDSSYTSAGAAWAFVRSGNSWAQKSYIKAPNTGTQDRFGHAVSLDASGETLIIGAHREGSKATTINGDQAGNTADAAGAVYIY